MEREVFFNEVARRVSDRLGEGHQVSLKEIRKNNRVFLTGLVIGREGVNISPTIYLDSFWQSYRWGMSLEAIAEKILEVYEREAPQESISMDFFKDFDIVKDRICFKLVNYEQNEELLKEIPHFRFLDMAVCFYYSYCKEPVGKGSILIYQSHMKLWGVSQEELKRIAFTNTPRLFPGEYCSMEELFLKMNPCSKEGREDAECAVKCCEAAEIPMYVMTNSSRIFGAAVILYEGLLKEISERLKSDLLMIPSSIHEVILLKADRCTDGETIRKMIREVNETQVEPEERLSDSLYRYDRKEDKLSVC